MLKGCTEPRVYTPPLRDLTPETSLGHLLIEFSRSVCGVELYPWEEWLAIHALELNEDGSFRFRFIVVLVARQNGKSTFGQILSLFFIYVLRIALIIGTAQTLDTAEEVWEGAVDLAESNEYLAPEVAKVVRRNGAKALKLVSGPRYVIKAASRKGGRGLSADLVLMDELREQTNWDAWDAITNTTMARPNAIVWCMSNAGDARSVVLRSLRVKGHKACGDPDGVAKALEGSIIEDEGVEAAQIGLFEWSAAPGCGLMDRDGWAHANPSLGYGRMTERALAAAIGASDEAGARTENLCQWVEAVIEKPFPDGAWESKQDSASRIDDDSSIVFGLDMSADRTMTSVAVSGVRADGNMHVELIARRGGFTWAAEFFAAWAKKHHGVSVALQGRGATVSSYAADLEAIEGVNVIRCVGKDVGAWCGRLYDAVVAEPASDQVKAYHLAQPALEEAIAVAQKKKIGDGAWVWNRTSSAVDISPVVAVTMAFGAAAMPKTKRRSSAYEDNDLVVV